jgi:hypothetical protein
VVVTVKFGADRTLPMAPRNDDSGDELETVALAPGDAHPENEPITTTATDSARYHRRRRKRYDTAASLMVLF